MTDLIAQLSSTVAWEQGTRFILSFKRIVFWTKFRYSNLTFLDEVQLVISSLIGQNIRYSSEWVLFDNRKLFFIRVPFIFVTSKTRKHAQILGLTFDNNIFC